MWRRGKARANSGEVGRGEILEDPVCLTLFFKEAGSELQ